MKLSEYTGNKTFEIR